MRLSILAFVFVGSILANPAQADWEDDARRTGDFLSRMQLTDGSVDEGENFSYIYLINTCRALALWSQYGLATGDTSRYQSEIDAAWGYVEANRPDMEVTKYLALESAGFTLIAGSFWREITGDTSRDSFLDEMVNFVNTTPINPAIATEVHALSQGFLGVGKMGDQTGNSSYQNAALVGAQYIKSIIEGNTNLLSAEAGEESGGMAFTAIAEYAFTSAAERKAWVEGFYPFLESCLTNGIYANAHTGWYVYAQYLAWKYGAELGARTNAYDGVTKLLAEDRERDGGIPNNFGGQINTDKAWASEALLWALTPFQPKADFAIASETNGVAVGQSLNFDYGLANNESSTSLTFLVAFMDIPGFGPSYLGVFTVLLPGGFGFVENSIPLPIVQGSPTGQWTLRVSVYDSMGQFQEQEAMSFLVF